MAIFKPKVNKNLDVQSVKELVLPEAPTKKQTKKDKDVFSFYALSYRLLSKHVKFLFPRFIPLEAKIKKGGMNVFYEAYVCGIVLISIVAGIVGTVLGIIISLSVKINPPEFGMILPLVMGAILSQGLFGFMNFYPAFKQKARHGKLIAELPYYMGYFATLSASGLTLEAIFKAVAKEESKEEIVKDAKTMIRNLDILGMDVLTALREMVSRSPTDSYTELLEGLISTVEGGGDLKEFFITTAKLQLEEKKLLMQKMTASLGIVSELYTILLIVFPLLSSIMLSIMAIMTPNLGGFSLILLMKLLAFVFVPVLGVMMLLLMDAMVPKR